MKTIFTNPKLLGFLFLITVFLGCRKITEEKQATVPQPPKSNQVYKNDFNNPFFMQDRPNPDFVTARRNDGKRDEKAANGMSIHSTAGSVSEFPDEQPMLLGAQLPNPYSIANMAHAYEIYYGIHFSTVPVTDLYVKFMPATESQLVMLEDSLELDLYDHPIDHELIQDGDYYVHPGRSIEDMPYVYTVVEPDFDFVSCGVPYIILAELHIPPHDNLELEELAESMALGATYTSTLMSDYSVMMTRTDITNNSGGNYQYQTPQHCEVCYDIPIFETGQICFTVEDPQYCAIINPPPPPPGGGGGPSTSCGSALTCTESGRPKGRIGVFDTQLGCQPLVNVKVICKNWFKGIRRNRHVYTDAQGMFTATQRFKRVKVKIRFRNAGISVRNNRNFLGIRLSLFNIQRVIGVYRDACEMNTINHLIENDNNRWSKLKRDWIAAHVINANEQHKAYEGQYGVKAMSDHRLTYYISRGGVPDGRGAHYDVPMLRYINHGFNETDVIDILKLALYTAKVAKGIKSGDIWGIASSAPALISTFTNLVFQGCLPDIILYYNTPNPNLSSNEINQKIYTTLTIASTLKNRADKEDWKKYLKANNKLRSTILGAASLAYSVYNIITIPGYLDTDQYATFNSITSAGSLVGTTLSFVQYLLLEMDKVDRSMFDIYNGFGEYYGHFLCQQKYGGQADKIIGQRREEISSIGTKSSHLAFLENYNPNEIIDEFRYLRTGLFNDLDDAVSFSNWGIRDNVSGITPQKQFKALTENSCMWWGKPPHNWHMLLQDLTTCRNPSIASDITDLFFDYGIH